MKLVYRILFGLHLFVGIGAMAGGLAAITNSQEPLGAPLSLLKNSPFSDFLVPGIILFTVIGVGNILSAVTMYFKSKFQGYISSVFAWGLVIWIVVQCIMIHTIGALHVIFFFYGLVQAALAAVIMFEKKLFPFNIVMNIYNGIRGQMD